MVTYATVLKALGGPLVVGGSDIEYGNWTPNKFKTVIVTYDGVYVETHLSGTPSITEHKPKKGGDASTRNPLRVFSHKQFGCLEVIAAPASMLTDANILRYFPDHTRLSAIIAIPDDRVPSVQDIARVFAKERRTHLQEHSNLKTDPRPLHMLPSASYLGTIQEIKSLDQMIECFPLAPQFYSSDLIEGVLATWLSSLSKTKTPQREEFRDQETPDTHPDDEGTTSTSLEQSLDDLLNEFDRSPARANILKFLKHAMDAQDTATLNTVATFCPDFSSLPPSSQPAWFTLFRSSPGLGANWRAERGALLDPSSSENSAALIVKANSVIREGLPTDWKGTLEDLAQHLYFSPVDLGDFEDPSDAFDEDEWGSEDDTIESDLSDLESDFDTSDTTEEGTEEEEDVDILSPEVLAFYRGLISTQVNDVLEAYDRAFSSGYEVFPPAGVLTQDEDGNGRLLKISSDGRAYMLPHKPEIMNLWRSIQVRLNLEVCPSRDLSEIAKVLITGSDNSGREYDVSRIYFPYKMLEYAYGFSAPKKGTLTYTKHQESYSWAAYRSKVLTPSLTSLLEFSVGMLLTQLDDSSHYYDLDIQNEIRDILSNITSCFNNCLLLSDYQVVDDSPVKIKLRALSDTPIQGNPLAEAIASSFASTGGKQAHTYEPIHEGIFYEYRHDMDYVLANSAPVWSYKLLESQLSQGKTISAQNLILGVGLNDEIISTQSGGLQYNSHTSHGTFAGSRSGKGLVTQSVLAGWLAARKPSGLADNKPDMSSLLLYINPNAFVINGSLLNPGTPGSDMFNVFTPEYIKSLESMAKIPPYLSELKGWSNAHTGALGVMVHLRYCMLALGILAARTTNNHLDELGGEEGISLIFDEVTLSNERLRSFLAGALSTSLVPERFLDAWKKHQAAIEQGTKPPSLIPVHPQDMWFTAVYNSIKKTGDILATLTAAGFSNREASVSDVFIIGQEIPKLVKPLNSLLPPANLERKGATERLEDSYHLLYSMLAVGGTDMFIGYAPKNTEYLNQGTGYAKDKLNGTRRCFAYVPAIAPADIPSLSGPRSEAIAKDKAVYFRPGLLFADGKETSYPWTNSVKIMEQAKLDVEAIRADVSNEDGSLHKGLDFLGYLEMAGVSRQDAYDSLQQMADIADAVVHRMGYPGNWKEFVYDLRPDWIFSAEDIFDIYAQGYSEYRQLRDFKTVFPEAFSNGSALAAAASSNLSESSESTWDFSDLSDPSTTEGTSTNTTQVLPHWDAPTADLSVASLGFGNSEFSAPPQPDVVLPSDYAPTQEIPAISERPVFQDLNIDPVKNSNIPTFGEPRVLAPTPVASVEEVQALLLNDLQAWVGDFRRVKSLAVLDGHLVLNRVSYQVETSALFQQNKLIPQYLRIALETSNIAPLLSWQLLRSMSELREINFDSWNFLMTDVAPDLGYSSAEAVIGGLFSVCPRLQYLTIGDDTITRSDYQNEYGTPSGLVRYDSIQRAVSVTNAFFGSGRRASWGYTRSAWSAKDLGFWGRTGRVAAGLTGAAVAGTAEVSSSLFKGTLGVIGSALSEFRNATR